MKFFLCLFTIFLLQGPLKAQNETRVICEIKGYYREYWGDTTGLKVFRSLQTSKGIVHLIESKCPQSTTLLGVAFYIEPNLFKCGSHLIETSDICDLQEKAKSAVLIPAGVRSTERSKIIFTLYE